MYLVVFTKGNDETVIAEFEELEKAREKAKELEKSPDYCDGLITIEQHDGKSRKIF